MADDDIPDLLPPNATATERALSQAAARALDVPVPLRALWDPDTIPAALLPWLAWGLSVDSWQPYWTEAAKRDRVRQAVARHRRKGTVAAVREVIAPYGAALALREWWQNDPPGAPHTFALTLTAGAGGDTSQQVQDDIVADVWRAKPVRAHFTLTAGAQAQGGIGSVGALRLGLFRRLRLTEAPWRGAMAFAGAARLGTFRRLTLSEA